MIITIVGMGVIGGSYAQALKKKTSHTIYGIDIHQPSIDKALAEGIIDDGETVGNRLLPLSDLVIFSIYPRSIVPFIQQHASNFKKGAVLNDATGVKHVIVDEILNALPNTVEFVFGHPMAGREKRGYDFADYHVFEGANYILTPVPSNTDANLLLIHNLMKQLGFKNIVTVSPQEHDELISFTSQLPHALAIALINSDIETRDTGKFIGDSYRELTRIANINEELWSELFLENKEYLLASIQNFEYELEKIKKSIEQDDLNALKSIFIQSSKRREKL